MSEHVSHEVRKRVEEKMRMKYMLHVRMPQRFLELLIPELVLSLLIYGFISARVITVRSYCAWLWIALIIFWILTWWLARTDNRHTYKLKHYYLCNLIAYGLFVLVSAIIFLVARSLNAGRSLTRNIYFLSFRLAYVLGLSDDKSITAGETLSSFVFFYGITLVIILIVPLFRMLKQSLEESMYKHESDARHQYEEDIRRMIEKEQERERRHHERHKERHSDGYEDNT